MFLWQCTKSYVNSELLSPLFSSPKKKVFSFYRCIGFCGKPVHFRGFNFLFDNFLTNREKHIAILKPM